MEKSHHQIGKVIKGVIIVTNINEEKVLQILEDFLNKRKWKIDMKNDIKSIKFYNQFHINSKDVWVVRIKIDLKGFEGSDIIELVISDKKETVEYWLDQNGIPQMF
jgi:hypothetical protein